MQEIFFARLHSPLLVHCSVGTWNVGTSIFLKCRFAYAVLLPLTLPLLQARLRSPVLAPKARSRPRPRSNSSGGVLMPAS